MGYQLSRFTYSHLSYKSSLNTEHVYVNINITNLFYSFMPILIIQTNKNLCELSLSYTSDLKKLNFTSKVVKKEKLSPRTNTYCNRFLTVTDETDLYLGIIVVNLEKLTDTTIEILPFPILPYYPIIPYPILDKI